ncbi:hypothetical protein HC891_07625 [Candidatus Gracilibacteria bacterium]|nr:hypothetical protein [Candidatus Gracilibacteria bacterium]
MLSLQIMRYDRRPEPRADEIRADWQAWLTRNGYTLFSSAEVNAAGLRTQIDSYRRNGTDPYVLYHPAYPPGGLRATLYILPDADALDNLLMRAQQMVATMMTVEARRRA